MAANWMQSIPLIGGVISGVSAWNQNRKNRKWQAEQNAMDRQFQREMYEWSRWDAQADWEREAAYNSPVQQMERLRQAGLNPNLIYGKGADNTMSSIRSGQMTGGNQPAPRNEGNPFGDALTKYYQLQNIQANTDNLAQQIALSKDEQLVKQATVAKMGQETAMTGFQLAQAMELKDSVIRQAKLNNEKTEWETRLTEQHQFESAIRIKKMWGEIDMQPTQRKILEQQLQNAIEDGRLKKAEAQLRAKGVNSNDPAYIRMLMQMILDPKYLKDLTARIK